MQGADLERSGCSLDLSTTCRPFNRILPDPHLRQAISGKSNRKQILGKRTLRTPVRRDRQSHLSTTLSHRESRQRGLSHSYLNSPCQSYSAAVVAYSRRCEILPSCSFAMVAPSKVFSSPRHV